MFFPFQFPAWLLASPSTLRSPYCRPLAGVIHTLAYQSFPTTLSDPVFGMKSLSAAIGYTTHGRRNAASAPPFLRTRGPHGGPLFASLRWPPHTGCTLEAIDRPRCVSHQQGAYSR